MIRKEDIFGIGFFAVLVVVGAICLFSVIFAG